MNRMSLAAVIAVASVAGFLGSMVGSNVFAPMPAEAQDSSPQHAVMQAKKTSAKIAVLDLEILARKSEIFADRRALWVKAEIATKEEVRALQSQIAAVKKELASGDAEDPDFLRKLIQLMEESMVTLKTINKEHLNALLEKYQSEVLEHVIAKAERYCAEHGFELLLQSYDRASIQFDQKPSERILNQTVLWTLPGEPGVDRVVVDITASVK